MATKYTADELQHHLSYEIDMLNGSYALIARSDQLLLAAGAPISVRAAALNALKEDFCVHARLLVEFFLKRRDNSAEDFANGYPQPSEPGNDLVRKLNNQIAHFMDGRTLVEADKIVDSDRTTLLRWIATELERWRPLRDSDYATIAIPSVDLTFIPPTGTTITAGGGSSPTNVFQSVGGPTGGMSTPTSSAPAPPRASQPGIRNLVTTVGLGVGAFIVLVVVVRFLERAFGY
jgi:hypothetical protein